MAKRGNHSCLGSPEDIRKVFNKFDKNGDGKISSDELKDILHALGSRASSDEVRRMMKEIDKDGDGYIDFDEFTEFHQVEIEGADDPANCGDRDLRDAFALYDLDKNGLISVTELHSVLRKLGEKCSLSDCTRMIRQVDADGDGHVNFEEFKKMMTKA